MGGILMADNADSSDNEACLMRRWASLGAGCIGATLGVTIHGLDISPLVRRFGPYAGSGLVVLICALIMLFGLALNRQRWGNYLTVGGVLICGPGGYMVGALAGDIGWRMLLVLLFVSGVIVTLIQIPSCGP